MNKDVGLWIDHRKAVIVTVSGETDEITQIASNVEKHNKSSDAAQEFTGEYHGNRRFSDHLRQYYDEVISRIRDAESILVMGPGEAKGEFVKRLQSEGLGGSVVGVEPADHMTDRQIVAIVRQSFAAKS